MKRGVWGLVPVGLLLVVSAVGLAWWNESLSVRTARALAEGERRTTGVAADALASIADGTLVHVSGAASSAGGVADPLLGVAFDALRVRRSVESYQWRRSSRSGDPDGDATYHLEWSARRIDSSGWPAEYQNPAEGALRSDTLAAADATLAGVPLDAALLARSDGFVDVPLDAALVAAVARGANTRAVAHEGALHLAYGGGRGDAPRVGDVRVRLEQVPPGVFSAVALLEGGRLQPAPTRSGVPVALLRSGVHSADALFAAAETERRGRTGLFRGLAAAVAILGFRMALHPLAALARLVPLVGGLLRVGVNGAAVALGAATAASTVAVAWVAVRPMVALPLLALAVAGVVWLARRPRTARAAAPSAVAVALALLLVATPGAAHAQGDAPPTIDGADALVAAAAAGGTFRLPAGTLRLDGTLDVARDLELVGAGPFETRVQLGAAGAGARVSGGATFSIRGLVLEYVGAGGDLLRVDEGRVAMHECALENARWATSEEPERRFGVGSGLVLRGSSTVTIESCVFAGHELASIEATDAARVEADEVGFTTSAAGVFADGSVALALDGAVFVDHPGNALHLRGEARAVLSGGVFDGSGGLGATPDEGFDGVRVGERARAEFDGVTWLDHPRFALSLWGEAQVDVRGGRFAGNGGTHPDGTQIYSAVLAADRAQLAFEGTLLEANPGGGVEALGAARVHLRDVTISRNGTFASVYVSEEAAIAFEGGLVEGNEGALFAAGDASLALDGTVVRDGLGVGVRLVERADGALSGAEVVDHADYGVLLEGEATVVVRDAFVAGNQTGIVAFDRTGLHVEGGVVVANRESGIVLVDRARAVVRGVRISGHAVHGVAVGDDATAEVVDNLFEGNRESAARFGERSSGRVAGNTMREGAVGVLLEGGGAPELGANTFEDVGTDVVGGTGSAPPATAPPSPPPGDGGASLPFGDGAASLRAALAALLDVGAEESALVSFYDHAAVRAGGASAHTWLGRHVRIGLVDFDRPPADEAIEAATGLALGEVASTLVVDASVPAYVTLVRGGVDADRLGAAFAARGYEAVADDRALRWCGPSGCDGGFQVDFGRRDAAANLFGGGLGRSFPAVVVGDLVAVGPLTAALDATLDVVAGLAPSLLDRPEVAALVDALDVDAALRQVWMPFGTDLQSIAPAGARSALLADARRGGDEWLLLVVAFEDAADAEAFAAGALEWLGLAGGEPTSRLQTQMRARAADAVVDTAARHGLEVVRVGVSRPFAAAGDGTSQDRPAALLTAMLNGYARLEVPWTVR